MQMRVTPSMPSRALFTFSPTFAEYTMAEISARPASAAISCTGSSLSRGTMTPRPQATAKYVTIHS